MPLASVRTVPAAVFISLKGPYSSSAAADSEAAHAASMIADAMPNRYPSFMMSSADDGLDDRSRAVRPWSHSMGSVEQHSRAGARLARPVRWRAAPARPSGPRLRLISACNKTRLRVQPLPRLLALCYTLRMPTFRYEVSL